jgi:hypothetical protein
MHYATITHLTYMKAESDSLDVSYLYQDLKVPRNDLNSTRICGRAVRGTYEVGRSSIKYEVGRVRSGGGRKSQNKGVKGQESLPGVKLRVCCLSRHCK